jgi:ABC-type glycerol-3-phosphate transport system substrate-binding protein
MRKVSYKAQTTFPVEDGKIFAYITGARTLQLIWNKKLFAEAGISKPPTTPEAFLDAARKLTKPAENQFGVGLKANIQHYEDTYDCLLQFPAGYGANFVKGGKIMTTDPNTVKGIDLYKTILTEKLTPVVLEAANREILFKNKMAMYIDGPWIFAEAKLEHPEAYPNLACADTPFPNKAAIGGANHFLMIPKDAKNKAGAAKFIEMWDRKEWQERHCMITGLVVARPDAIPPQKVKEDPWFQAFKDGMETAVPPIPEGYEKQASKFQKIVVEAVLDRIVSQNQSTAAVMADIVDDLEGLR